MGMEITSGKDGTGAALPSMAPGAATRVAHPALCSLLPCLAWRLALSFAEQGLRMQLLCRAVQHFWTLICRVCQHRRSLRAGIPST